MPATLPLDVDLSQSAAARGGVLEGASPAPDGWEGGLVVPFYGCGEPQLLAGCATSIDEGNRVSVVETPSFEIVQSAWCSTISGTDQDQQALDRLAATSEYALGRQLVTNELDFDAAPSLANAESIGEAEDVVAGIGCLEEQVALTGFGSRYFLHASPRTAAYLRNARMMDNDGRSPAGARWIISPGYAGTDPGRVWATGTVWAAVGAPIVDAATEHRLNTYEAIARRPGIVLFDPCINLSVDIPVGACPTP